LRSVIVDCGVRPRNIVSFRELGVEIDDAGRSARHFPLRLRYPRVIDGPPQSYALCAGMIAINPQGAWHRFQSSEGVTLMAATPFPSEVIELDVDDPRTVARKPASAMA
jgi:hypothetical protein